MTPVSLVGLGPSSHGRKWLRKGWETWGMATDPWAPNYDLIFKMHDSFEWEPYELSVRRLNEMGRPICLQREIPGITKGFRYPLEDVIGIGRDYFGSSLAYMLGLAILQNRPRIALMGFEMQGQDGYAHQRNNAEYWIGLAEGRGLEIEVSEGSKLLKLWDSGFDEPGEQSARNLYGLNGRYGYLKEKTNGSNNPDR